MFSRFAPSRTPLARAAGVLLRFPKLFGFAFLALIARPIGSFGLHVIGSARLTCKLWGRWVKLNPGGGIPPPGICQSKPSLSPFPDLKNWVGRI